MNGIDAPVAPGAPVPAEPPAAPPPAEQVSQRWEGRPWLARGVRSLVVVVPFAVSVAVAYAMSQALPPASGPAWLVGRLVAIAATATVALRATDRVVRRLLPLATLLDLTLLFPDQAPSRYRMALRNGASNVELEARIDRYTRSGEAGTAAAAEHLLDLVAALSRHDRITRGHSERVRAYAQMIGEEMKLGGPELDRLRWAALIHDVGKLRVPTEILNKPGRLTDEEFEVIKRHPEWGAELAVPLSSWLGESVLAVVQHHEKWDGTGYPLGLRGTEISLSGRIVAVADVFDVLTSARSYKSARTAVEARAELARCAGTHFDPTVVRAFMSLSLGRLRFVMGPLSWIAQLSLFPQSLLATAASPVAAAATVTAGAAAATVGAVAMPAATVDRWRDPPAIEVLFAGDGADGAPHSAFGDPVVTVVAPSIADAPAPGGSGPAVVRADPVGDTPDETPDETPDGSATSSPEAIGGEPSSSPATATASTVSSTTVSPPPPPSTNDATPDVPGAPPVTGPGAPPATEPFAPPGTTPVVAPTTAPATTPPTPPPTTAAPVTTLPATLGTYLFAAPSPGDTASAEVLAMVQRTVQQVHLPNHDVDRNSQPGLTIVRGGAVATGDPVRMQRFAFDPASGVDMHGVHAVQLWVAADAATPVEVRVVVALARCNDHSSTCTVLDTGETDVIGVRDVFQLVSVDLGRQTGTVPAAQRLEVWVLAGADSGADLLLAYDAGPFASGLVVTP